MQVFTGAFKIKLFFFQFERLLYECLKRRLNKSLDFVNEVRNIYSHRSSSSLFDS